MMMSAAGQSVIRRAVTARSDLAVRPAIYGAMSELSPLSGVKQSLAMPDIDNLFDQNLLKDLH